MAKTQSADSGFPDLASIVGIANSEYEAAFVREEYGQGLAYYLARLDRLMLSGASVLDAGCGAGQWSIAFSQRFGRVSAVDPKPSRLKVLSKVAREMSISNLDVSQGSIERTPFRDRAFDVVFCYGVIMFVDLQQALSEIYRVLKPGGRAYVCLNGDGWSHFLIHERGKAESVVKRVGEETLYTTYLARAELQGLHAEIMYQASRGALGLHASIDRGIARLRKLGIFGGPASSGRGHRWPPIAESLMTLVSQHCGDGYVPMLEKDLAQLGMTGEMPHRFGRTRAYGPDELRLMVERKGFVQFEWESEGCLACDWMRPPVKPRYEGYYSVHGQRHLSVWECMFVKPAVQPILPSPESYFRASEDASRTPLFIESSGNPVLSNATRETFPKDRLSHARLLSARLGSEHLRDLVRKIVADAADEEEAARRLIVFVQRSIYRDPVSQPLDEGGALPDAQTILLCARGRCGHAAKLLVEMAGLAGLSARQHQLPRHITAHFQVNRRWVLAEADIFKQGILPLNTSGKLPTLEELKECPGLLDRYPPSGWMLRPGTRYTRGVLGHEVRGYVDALEPDERGFVSGYFDDQWQGYPPQLPSITHFVRHTDRVELRWTPSQCRDAALRGYRVRIGTRPRGWSYNDLLSNRIGLSEGSACVLNQETEQTRVNVPLPSGGPETLYAAVTAVSDRVEREPATYFWPSEEAEVKV